MLTIKKISILVSLVWLSFAPLDAQAGKYSFSLAPLFGILHGQGEEILYKYPGRDQYVSQLLWDLKPLFYFGLAADFGPKDPFRESGFTAAGSVKSGLPLKTGIMEDRDWQYPDNERLTNYSRHNALSQNALWTEISAGYSWRVTDRIAAGVYGEFSYMRFSWAAEGGYYQYLKANSMGNYLPGQTWTSDIPKTPIYGTGIQYTQNWLTFSPAIFVKGKIGELFSAEGNFKYTPLVFCADSDYHFLPNRYYNGSLFTGYFNFGHFFESAGKIVFLPEKNFSLSLSVSYKFIKGDRGNTYYERTYTGAAAGILYQSIYDGAAGYSAFDFGIAAKIRVTGRD